MRTKFTYNKDFNEENYNITLEFGDNKILRDVKKQKFQSMKEYNSSRFKYFQPMNLRCNSELKTAENGRPYRELFYDNVNGRLIGRYYTDDKSFNFTEPIEHSEYQLIIQFQPQQNQQQAFQGFNVNRPAYPQPQQTPKFPQLQPPQSQQPPWLDFNNSDNANKIKLRHAKTWVLREVKIYIDEDGKEGREVGYRQYNGIGRPSTTYITDNEVKTRGYTFVNLPPRRR